MHSPSSSDTTATASAHPIVVLTGFMGSGKTTTAQALAELLGWRCVDLDRVIEMQEGAEIRQLFRRHGEARFREIEHGPCGSAWLGATVRR